MGLTLGFQATNLQQEFLNNIVQENQQSCSSTVTPTNSNQVIIATNSKLNGATIGQINQTSTDASCLITAGMQTSVANILSATTQQTSSSESDILSIFSAQENFAATNLKESVTNNIYQISQASCTSSTAPANSSQYAYFSGDSLNNAFIGQSNTTNATSSCSMTNFMKINTYNQGQGDAGQQSKQVGTLGAIGGVIAVILVIVIILVGMFFLVTLLKRGKGGKKGVDHCTIDPKTGVPPMDPATNLPYSDCALPPELLPVE